MERKEIIEKILQSDLNRKWHWFSYHFKYYEKGLEHPFAKSIVDYIYNISQINNDAGIDLINKLTSISGKEKDLGHYEQLMQVLAEILIINQAFTYPWSDLLDFEYEPVTAGSNKNPEFNIITNSKTIGIEVKSPSILKYQTERQSRGLQLTSRNIFRDVLEKGETTLPRDNPIKDFLLSANSKFKEFKEKNPDYISVLYIVWDDFINEPISALLAKPHGLFESDSFAKDKSGEIIKFQYVDFVMISRHRLQFQQTAGEVIFPDEIEHPLDYGKKEIFPFKVIIKNPYSTANDFDELVDCFQVYEPSSLMGAEYNPGDIIMWM